MNIFNLGRGNFFGIIIPGAFLLGNILFINPQLAQELNKIDLLKSILENNYVLLPFLTIISYIIGFSLRLLRPTYLEKFSIIFWSFYIVYKHWINPKSKDRKLSTVISSFKAYWESFPYIDWFYDSLLSKVSVSYRNFYEDKILKKEYAGDKELMKGLNFINHCKLFIYDKSDPLRNEILYDEGLVRFLSGMCYVLSAIIIFAIFFTKPTPWQLIIIYGFLNILFMTRLRYIRVKEVLAVFDSYFLLKT